MLSYIICDHYRPESHGSHSTAASGDSLRPISRSTWTGHPVCTKPYTLTVTGFGPCRLLRSAERIDNDERYHAADEQRRNIASARRPCTDRYVRSSRCQLSAFHTRRPPPAVCCPVMAISSDIFLRRVNYWSCSHVLYQLPPPAGHRQCF